MSIGRPVFYAGLLAAAIALTGGAKAATVVTNGSFEQGVPGNTPGTVNGALFGQLPSGSPSSWDVWTNLIGWTTSRGPGVELQTDGTHPTVDAQDGEYYAELDSTANSSIYQDVALHVGRYMLSFWYNSATGNFRSDGINYRLSGLTSGRVTSATPGVVAGAWTQVTVEFLVKTAKNYRLTFAASGRSDGSGGLLDNIEIVPVPVPASGLVLLGALGGLAMLRRRITGQA
ncbi:MAG: VPLPA-CTERM sorting domain-containing protein [Paracoccaceae bacterium]